MPIRTTPVLDSFDGTGALSGSWNANRIWTGQGAIVRDAGTAHYGAAATEWWDAAWDTEFSQGLHNAHEVHTIVSTGSDLNGGTIILWLRLSALGSPTGYALSLERTAAGVYRAEVNRYVTSAGTFLASQIGVNIADGDEVVFVASGDNPVVLQGYSTDPGAGPPGQMILDYNDSSASRLSPTNSRIGLEIKKGSVAPDDTGIRLDDFGGGLYNPPSARRMLMTGAG